jgi:hypothetical protein
VTAPFTDAEKKNKNMIIESHFLPEEFVRLKFRWLATAAGLLFMEVSG